MRPGVICGAPDDRRQAAPRTSTREFDRLTRRFAVDALEENEGHAGM